MAKKDFKGIDALFSDDPVEVESQIKDITPERRCTLILREDLLEKVKAIAFEERTTIKDVMAQTIENFLDEKAKEKGDNYVESALMAYRKKS